MKRNFFSAVVKGIFMTCIAVVVLTSCQEDLDASAMRFAKNEGHTTVISEWQHNRLDTIKGYHDDYVVFLDDEGTDRHYRLTGDADLWCNEYNYKVEEKYEYLNVMYSNTGRTGGHPHIVKNDTGYVAVTNFFFPLEDGNTACVSDTCLRVNNVPGDSLIDVRLLSLNNVDEPGNGPHKAPMTRAQYLKKEVYTEVKAELTYRTVGMTGVPDKNIVLCDTITRQIMADDAIDHVEILNKGREVLDDVTERCYFTERFIMKSGETNDINKSRIISHLFKGIDDRNLIVSSFEYTFGRSFGLTDGSEHQLASDGSEWTVWGKTDEYGATINGETNPRTEYTLYHERCQYKDSWVTVDFEYLKPEVSEAGTNVLTATSDQDGYDKAILRNEVSTIYGGHSQNLSENINLYKEAKHIDREGWDELSAKKIFYFGYVHCQIDYVVYYSDGEEVRTKFEHDFERNLVCTSHWTALVANNSQNTSNVTRTAKVSPKEDNGWNWIQEISTYVSNVTLAGDVIKENTWEAVEANSITVTYRGQKWFFGKDDYTFSNSASVGSGVVNGSVTEFAYADKLTHIFGTTENQAEAKSLDAPGTIRVEIEEDTFFPKEWGKLKAVYQTVAPNETRKDYVYTLSLHFENGTIPVAIRRDADAPEWNFEYFSSCTDARFNGGFYKKALGKWVNTIASDEADWMLWLNESDENQGNMTYALATTWNWDEGHLVNGHPSVTTKRFKFQDPNTNGGVLFITDTYTGKQLRDSHCNADGGWK